MLTKLKKRNEGFTIIEVLIVLAIAGLIMLIVFLAVPALQRNSRNTAARNDVANVLGGVAEYQAANGGAMPTGIAGTGTINYTGANAVAATIQGTTQVALNNAFPGQVGIIHIQIGSKCDGTANTRAVAARYLIERAGGTTQQCQDS